MQRWAIVWLIARNELSMLLRSRRTVVTTFVLPIVAWPVVALISHLGARAYETRTPARTLAVAFTGAGAATLAQALTDRCRASDIWIEASFPELEDPETLLESSVDRSSVDVVLALDQPRIELFERFDLERSRSAADLLEECLEIYRAAKRHRLLDEKAVEASWSRVLDGRIVDTAPRGMRTRRVLGNLLPIVFLGFVLSGGSLVAFSTLAGERESGTLETLLSSSARRREIVAGKAIAVFVLALAVALLQLGNIFLWLGILRPASLDTRAHPEVVLLTPAASLGLFALLLPLALLISSLLLMLSCHARTYREAQQMFYPLLLVTAVPALLGYWPEAEATPWHVLVPIGNTTLAVRDLLIGELGGGWLAFNVLYNLALTAVVLTHTSRALDREGAMLRGSEEWLLRSGSSSRALARVLPVTAVLWLISGWFRAHAASDSEAWPAWVYAIMLMVAAGLAAPGLPLSRLLRAPGRHRAITVVALFPLGMALSFLLRPLSDSWWQPSLASASKLLALLAVFAAEELFFRGALLRDSGRLVLVPVSILCYCSFAPAGSLGLALVLSIVLTAAVTLHRSMLAALVLRLAFEVTPLLADLVAGLLSGLR